jgi:hypothetical protein
VSVTGIADFDLLASDTVVSLSVQTAGLNAVLVVETTASGISFNKLYAHDFKELKLRSLDRICSGVVGLVDFEGTIVVLNDSRLFVACDE